MKKITAINPANEQVLQEFELQSASEVDEAIGQSARAFGDWRRLSLERRLDCFAEFAKVLNSARMSLAELMTEEMGKTLKESLGEVDKGVTSCAVLQKEFPAWLAQRNYSLPQGYSITHQPLGVIFGIMPWNYPLWQVLRFALPALACGNSVLLKHAPNTWGSARLIADLFRQAFPDQLYIDLRIDVDQAAAVIADPRVRGVSLTGSREAGIQVGRTAAEHLKKCVLELGGSDAYVILDDADLDLSAQICATSRLINAGQSCVSAKRFIVTKKNAPAFTEKFTQALKQKSFGDPMQSVSDFGPLARKDLRAKLHQQVQASCARGAQLALGGQLPQQKGYFYPATLLTAVQPGQAAFDEELFGPVAALIEAADESQALRLANQSRYGLGGAVFSRDVARAKALATSDFEAGMVFINGLVASDVLFPFGGVKDSGLGRELGREGCFEFTNVKTVYVKP
jgi:succinate-semialdehyde dehydrogenase/glutarate-semialdehyde dehydrogenase